ncbi:MAG: family 43 glycosylhydrolase [Clostridia bacterium]|nr:family 43 glycosylhydrolase [Clostridia bacterium]
MYFRPKNSVLADVIPYYENGTFYLYYLRNYCGGEPRVEGIPWELLTTTDLVNLTEHGEAICAGTPEEQDMYIFTGSVLKGGDGAYYAFYTGHNHYLMAKGGAQQLIMLAKSSDLIRWEKTDFTLGAPSGYDKHDFRDPFVYYDESVKQYRMVLAARKDKGDFCRRGCLLSYLSTDLQSWKLEPQPFYAPDAFYMHECPDLFRMGEWYYLIFSEFNDKHCTRYRMSKSPTGPWIAPEVDTFDNRCFYAAKTAAKENGERYLFGWNPTREGEKDYGGWQWGGSFVVHQLCQRADGTLYAKLPDSVANAFGCSKPQSLSFQSDYVQAEGGTYKTDPLGYAFALLEQTPNVGKISCEFTYRKGGDFGLMLRYGDEGRKTYFVKIDPRNNRLCFDRTERPKVDMQFMVETERTVTIIPNKRYNLTVCLEGEIVEVYLDGETAMSVRMYDFKQGLLGVYGNFADVTFSNIKVSAK